jgi:hypothetical protein
VSPPRSEKGAWKIVHRHADTRVNLQLPAPRATRMAMAGVGAFRGAFRGRPRPFLSMAGVGAIRGAIRGRPRSSLSDGWGGAFRGAVRGRPRSSLCDGWGEPSVGPSVATLVRPCPIAGVSSVGPSMATLVRPCPIAETRYLAAGWSMTKFFAAAVQPPVRSVAWRRAAAVRGSGTARRRPSAFSAGRGSLRSRSSTCLPSWAILCV